MIRLADSGFVVSLYKVEAHSPTASALVAAQPIPVLIARLALLEVQNAFQLGVFRGDITPAEAKLKQKRFKGDLRKGLLKLADVSEIRLYARAIQLAWKFHR